MRVLKKWVKNRIDLTGYEIQRKKNPARLNRFSHKPSAGSILEMIGPTGIGKSTLFASLIDELGKNWFLPRHASELLLSSLDHDAELTYTLRRLLMRKVTRLYQESNDFWIFSGLLNYSVKVARTDILMRSGFQRGYALDEGVFQVFADELLELEKGAQQRLCTGRYLVLLNARDPNTIAKRAFRRHEDRLLRGHFQHPTTFDMQRKRAIKAMSLYSKVAESAQDCGVKVLRLFAEDDVSKSREAVLEFSRRIGRA